MSSGNKTGLRLLAALAGLLLWSSCAWMSEDMAGLFLREDVYSRDEVKTRLRSAIGVNMGTCSNNNLAGYYALDYIVPSELNEAFYRKDSVDGCVIALMATPCISNPNNDLTLLTNLYRAVIRSCGGPVASSYEL